MYLIMNALYTFSCKVAFPRSLNGYGHYVEHYLSFIFKRFMSFVPKKNFWFTYLTFFRRNVLKR